MNVSEFTHQVQAASQRAIYLRECVHTTDPPFPALMEEALAQLQATVEELQVAEEELHAQVEELLAAKEHQDRGSYQNFFDTALDGYLVTDPHGVIWEANPIAAQLLKVPLHFLIGKPLLLYFTEADRMRLRTRLALLQEAGPPIQWRAALTPREGPTLEVGLTVALSRDKAGTYLRWQIRDLKDQIQCELAATEIYALNHVLEEHTRRICALEEANQRKDELLLREHQARLVAEAAYQEAQEANHLKDVFLATLSHELRTPLNAIIGFSQLLMGGKLDKDGTQRAIQTIERNARLQAQLIEDLLDVSRIITGKLPLKLQVVETTAVVESALETIRPTAQAKGVEIISQLESPAATLHGDANRLQQVVWNLLSNAIKFTPRGGRVEVRLERVSEEFLLTVSDTGQGIRADFLPYVFERFRQADDTSTRIHGGLGLGLAIVHHLVELHGGTVSAYSAGEGKGAIFTVSLPVGSPRSYIREGTSMTPDQPNLPLLSGTYVLVVDDEPEARQLTTTILEQCGATVVTASSAREALELIAQRRPDCLLSDIAMPDMDGYTLIRQLREQEAILGSTPLPAAALTAYTQRDERSAALDAGYQLHIGKPLAPVELVIKVANLTQRRESASPGILLDTG
ncbi:hybrid sensor histidine kinase/response regulator [Anthocerotibacter panamensis]|uniref:hybrid sensor histidine kinase/response regulator n=1 Tax=Anthocerotibacter panamensis TaxID=2857077 RepID=UPI001C403EA6|nr:ATP-binding protein [Anthocerotibacter panamensis]